MPVDSNTLLTALYTIVDDLYKGLVASSKPCRPGPKPQMSDSEVITLFVVAQWRGGCETDILCYTTENWRAYFPRLLDQSAFNRRVHT